MSEHMTITAGEDERAEGLLVARRRIVAARSRDEQFSDGGSTGRSDTND